MLLLLLLTLLTSTSLMMLRKLLMDLLYKIYRANRYRYLFVVVEYKYPCFEQTNNQDYIYTYGSYVCGHKFCPDFLLFQSSTTKKKSNQQNNKTEMKQIKIDTYCSLAQYSFCDCLFKIIFPKEKCNSFFSYIS